jgi:hypothetical protein
MALRDNIGNGGNDSVLAFVALARVYPSNGQEHALAPDCQSSARCRAVSRREHFLDSVRHDQGQVIAFEANHNST